MDSDLEKLRNLQKADVVRFIDWYEEDPDKRTKMTIATWGNEHELSEIAKEFKEKCIDFYERRVILKKLAEKAKPGL